MIPEITYCDWQGDAAILAEYSDGRTLGFAMMHDKWSPGHEGPIIHNGKVMTEAAFHRRFPGLALPPLPE